MSANNTTNSSALIRSELWQRQLEEILHETLTGTPFVRQLDFPDGDSFTLPSIGTATVRTLPEDTEVTFDALDTGEQSFTLQDPVVAATSISEVFLEDSLWSADLMSAVPVEHAAAIMERFETDVFALADNQQNKSTGSPLAGIEHRRKGHGTAGHIDPSDFAYAGFALKKAKLPNQNLMAIVSPSVAYDLETLTNLVDVSNNPRWEGIVDTGITKNMRFVRNVYGFDVFESNLLAESVETLDGVDFSTNGGVQNIFMSAAREMILPFAIAWRRRAEMQRDFDFKLREEQIITTARWGAQLVRNDNLIVTVTEDIVA